MFFWSFISDGIAIGDIYSCSNHFLSTSGNIIGTVSVLFDLSDIYQAIKEGDDYKLFLGCYNFSSDVIGFLGPAGTYVSLTMKYNLKLAFKIADFEMFLRRQAVHEWKYSLQDPWGYCFEEN